MNIEANSAYSALCCDKITELVQSVQDIKRHCTIGRWPQLWKKQRQWASDRLKNQDQIFAETALTLVLSLNIQFVSKHVLASNREATKGMKKQKQQNADLW